MRRRRSKCMGWAAVVLLAAVGCKSDFNQQLLERELRLQEDQIYQLQDELQDKCVRLDRTAAENQSLKKQLGVADFPESRPGRSRPTPAGPAVGGATVAPPVLAPPTIEDLPPPPRSSAPSGGSRFGSPDEPPPAFRGTSGPPALDGLPPLTDEPVIPGGGVSGTGLNTEAAAPPTGTVRRLSHEQREPGVSGVTHLMLNVDATACVDGDGDGASDALAIVFEPRDAEGRLVATVGDVSIAVYEPLAAATAADPSGEGMCIARWDVPAAEAAGQFRRTSRHRGLHVVKPWPGPRPSADHVRVFVRMTTFEGQTFETNATVPTK